MVGPRRSAIARSDAAWRTRERFQLLEPWRAREDAEASGDVRQVTHTENEGEVRTVRTVAAVRSECEATGQSGQLDTRTGADGKERPARMNFSPPKS